MTVAVVVGSTNVDLVLSVPALPAPGETVLATSSARLAGGKGGNQAVALARLGATVRFCSAVGDDHDGVWSRRQLAAAGVDTSEIVTQPELPTGQAVVMVDPAGENAIVVTAGANAAVAAPDDLSGADVLLLSLEVPMVVVAAAAAAGRRAGIPVVLNAAPAARLDDVLIADVTVLVVNEVEAADLRPFHRPGLAVVITQGARGVTVHLGGATTHLPAHPAHPVDTTGAGDCFAAALAGELGAGQSLLEAAAFAVVAAALSTEQTGARTGLPTRAQVLTARA